MQAAVSEAADPTGIVGKRELAQHLKWSRPTLDRRLLQDPMFPVRSRGSRAGGWEFDLAAVRAYLNGVPAEPAPPAAELDLVFDAAPARSVHTGEATARQRRDQADAALKEDRLRKLRGDLVEAEAMRETLGTVFAGLAAKLKGMPEVLVRRLKLPEQAGAVIREEIDRIQRAMVEELRGVLDE